MNPPFYGIPLTHCTCNTQGGPRRNERGEVLDVEGNPIPHLYEAGELGDIWSNLYQASCNLGGGMIFGRISGANAAAVKDDSVQDDLVADGYVYEPAIVEYECGENQYIGRGKRFVREDLPFQSVSNAQNAQPAYGRNCWYVFDETMYDGMQDALEEFEAKGWLFEGATPQELAEKCGVDPEGLAATIERYNGFFAGGVDEDFRRDLAMTLPFTDGRYFALTSNSCVLATVGGLTIDGTCAVLDLDDKPIAGLYACGNASGNFFAGNYPRHIPGTSIGRAVTFGYVAAENCVNSVVGPDPVLDGAVALTPYGEGAPVDEATLEAAQELGPWNPYDPIHGGSDAYSAEQLGGNVAACDNCHTYDPSRGTVADEMK